MKLKKPPGRRLSIVEKGVLAKDETTEMINFVIGLFKEINPMYTNFYSMKTERAACKRLIKAVGVDKIHLLMQWYLKELDDRFCPVFTSPTELEKQMGRLIIFYRKKNSSKQNRLLII